MNKALFLLPFCSVLMIGCAGTADHLRSRPTTFFKATIEVATPADLSDYIQTYCLREVGIDQSDSVKGSPTDSPGKECLYLSVDAGKMLGKSAAVDKDKAVNLYAYLISISDLNCSTHLHRSFANKAGLDFTKGLVSDLASGVSAGTAFSNPSVAAGLSVGNLIIGKGVDNFDKTYYLDKTFQALDAAITAERSKRRVILDGKTAAIQVDTTGKTYNLAQIVADVREYDDTCSFRAGLAQLVKIADAEKDKQTTCKDLVQLEPVAKRATKAQEPCVPSSAASPVPAKN